MSQKRRSIILHIRLQCDSGAASAERYASMEICRKQFATIRSPRLLLPGVKFVFCELINSRSATHYCSWRRRGRRTEAERGKGTKRLVLVSYFFSGNDEKVYKNIKYRLIVGVERSVRIIYVALWRSPRGWVLTLTGCRRWWEAVVGVVVSLDDERELAL